MRRAEGVRRIVLASLGGGLALIMIATAVIAQAPQQPPSPPPMGPYARLPGENDEAYQARLERDFGIRFPGPLPKFTAPPAATARPVPASANLRATPQPMPRDPRTASPEELERAGLRLVPPIDQLTRGKEIEIGGKKVQLPQDAYVDSIVLRITCEVPGCLEEANLPIYWIARGESRIAVGERSGRILGEQLAPGQEQAFDFLRAALR